MEKCTRVNDILKAEISKINCHILPPGFRGDSLAVRLIQDTLSQIIDRLGEQSTSAQGLNKVITTTDKLRNSPNHVLYLLKDGDANNGAGAVIGLLKMGYKKLFLFDRHAQVVECEPLCVLDFYVERQLQRQGHGRRLFDYMLQDYDVEPTQLAIDGPSEKMITFLRKNYHMDNLIRQPNNFAVAPEFFVNHLDNSRDSGHRSPSMMAGVGRHSAPKPRSTIGAVIHGGGGNSPSL